MTVVASILAPTLAAASHATASPAADEAAPPRPIPALSVASDATLLPVAQRPAADRPVSSRATRAARPAPAAPVRAVPAPPAAAPVRTAPRIVAAPRLVAVRSGPRAARGRPASVGTGVRGTRGDTAPGGNASAVLAFALSKVGQRYRSGGSGNGGWDCSGLVSAAYRSVGVDLPHSSGGIGGRGQPVPAGQWRPGDVIHTSGHVALYLGDGLMVEAANPRDGVRITPIRGGQARRLGG